MISPEQRDYLARLIAEKGTWNEDDGAYDIDEGTQQHLIWSLHEAGACGCYHQIFYRPPNGGPDEVICDRSAEGVIYSDGRFGAAISVSPEAITAILAANKAKDLAEALARYDIQDYFDQRGQWLGPDQNRIGMRLVAAILKWETQQR